MVNPYKIEGPAQISFSGGRSSGMMLCKIAEAHDYRLPNDVVVCFANTGKEREETLTFVDQVARHLGIFVHWIEFEDIEGPQIDRWREVSIYTASRNGEPFETMVKRRGYMPNPVARICTQHLKIKPMEAFTRQALGLANNKYLCVSGIRADEQRRVAKMRARTDVEFALPLADAGVAQADVLAFWAAMPFDLGLPTINGRTMHGNCDLCYLKGTKQLISLIREDPERADWWAKMETDSGTLFHQHRPNYAAMKIIAMQPQLFDAEEEDALPCECVD
jgi:hypothetical protein